MCNIICTNSKDEYAREERIMNLYPYFRSILEMDRCAVVICNLAHEIIYMNPVACTRYAKRGGAELVGKSLLDCHSVAARERIEEVLDWFRADSSHNMVYTFRNEKENKDVYMVALREEDGTLIGYYEKHEYRTVETEPLYHMGED